MATKVEEQKIGKLRIRTITKTIIKRPKKTYIASADGEVVHADNCPFAKKIEKKKRIHFKSKTQAFNAKYKACTCILEGKKIRRRGGRKKAAKKPKVRTVVRTVVKKVVIRPKKHYIASKGGEIVHEDNCPFAKKIDPVSRVEFKSKTEALNAGYKACNCIRDVEYQKRRKKRVIKKKVPCRRRTIVKTVVKRPKKVYVAAKDNKTLHIKECPFARKIEKGSKVIVRSKEKAFNEGYKACGCISEKAVAARRRRKKVVKKVPKTRTIVKTVVRIPRKVYVAAKDSKTLHLRECSFARKIEKENRIIIRSKTKAFNEGYKPCNCITGKVIVEEKNKKAVVKTVKKIPVKTRTIVKTIVKRPKKTYVASKEGKVVHIKECPFAKNIAEKSRIVLRSKTKALNEGYKACSCIKKVKEEKKVVKRRKSLRKKAVKKRVAKKRAIKRKVVKKKTIRKNPIKKKVTKKKVVKRRAVKKTARKRAAKKTNGIKKFKKKMKTIIKKVLEAPKLIQKIKMPKVKAVARKLSFS
ncbi:MAG: hypothetical protein ABH824_02660 [Nanoarchaeota archaeon]|nr:hypothetical protein [Nanoarchaeota archaeon]MBU1632116.1 hypothetical protein [Nanoarchaeota archaeon]MBU1876181.1 hypothetical protein [Nanoarchaeota archaeon]